MAEPKKIEHGAESCFYTNHPEYGQLPVLECCCGEQCIANTWKDAGELLDEHLKEVKNG